MGQINLSTDDLTIMLKIGVVGMARIFLIIICIALLCPLASPLEMNEIIVISGAGSMKSVTEIPNAMESIDSEGSSQIYNRNFYFEEDLTSYSSNFVLYNIEGHDNTYLIDTNAKDEKLQHIAKLTGNSNIISNSSVMKGVNRDGSLELSTNYNISGKGKLFEQVIDQNLGVHPEILVDTKAEGDNVLMISGISDSAYGSEANQALSKLPKTKSIMDVNEESPKSENEYPEAKEIKTPETQKIKGGLSTSSGAQV